MFGDIEVKKSAFHKFKYPIDINEVSIGKIVMSKVLNALLDTKMITKLNHCV